MVFSILWYVYNYYAYAQIHIWGEHKVSAAGELKMPHKPIYTKQLYDAVH